MESGAIPDSDIFVSSGSGSARYNLQAWEPVEEDTNPYIAISFRQPTQITMLTIRGSEGKYFQEIEIESSLQGTDLNPVSFFRTIYYLYICSEKYRFSSTDNLVSSSFAYISVAQDGQFS